MNDAGLNPRQERFAQSVAGGETQRAAHSKAGYEPDDANASHLTSNHKVAARIDAIQETRRKAMDTTVEGYLQSLLDLETASLAEKQFGAAVRARELFGKVLGLYVERFKSEDTLTDEQLLAPLADLLPAKVLEELRIKLAG